MMFELTDEQVEELYLRLQKVARGRGDYNPATFEGQPLPSRKKEMGDVRKQDS